MNQLTEDFMYRTDIIILLHVCNVFGECFGKRRFRSVSCCSKLIEECKSKKRSKRSKRMLFVKEVSVSSNEFALRLSLFVLLFCLVFNLWT